MENSTAKYSGHRNESADALIQHFNVPGAAQGSALVITDERMSDASSASITDPSKEDQSKLQARAYSKGALEAILMVVNEPIAASTLAQTIDETEAVTIDLLREIQQDLNVSVSYPRGIQLREVAAGWRFYSHPRYADVVTEYVTTGQNSKLSIQALETLAVIAYRQPVTRAQIAAIRGVDVDSVVRTLVTRGLVEVVGTTQATGATLYGTTNYFLERMGMNSLDDLEPLAPYLPDDIDLDLLEKEIQ